jgi:hypothetical protein
MPRQDVTDSGRKYWRLPLEVANQEHAAADSERLDSDQPMLRNAAMLSRNVRDSRNR